MRKLFLLLSCFFVFASLQSIAQKKPAPSNSNPSSALKLKTAVDAWQARYNVNIVYSSTLENIQVARAATGQFSTVEDELGFALASSKLVYEKVKDKFYVITLKTSAREQERLAKQLNEAAEDAITVTGTVTDKKGGTLQGVSVLLKSAGSGTSTGKGGKYTITSQRPSQDVLVFSFSGYKTVEENIAGRAEINLIMQDSVATMQEVVVTTALGLEVKRDKIGYSAAKINGDQVANSPEANLIDAMGGKASGVRINRSSGSDPGSASQILIRGQSTITRGTGPLIVLDGIPIGSDARGESSQGVTQQSRLNDINPDDIASMTILKGASAAALWGTRAANGVVVITTKKGTGGKAVITFKSSYSIDKVNLKYKLQDAYGQGSGGVWKANNSRSWGDKIADRTGADDAVNTAADFFVGNTGKIYYPVTAKNSRATFLDKNYDDVFGLGHYLNNSLTASGGDSKGNYFFSLSDLNQKGVIQANSGYRRNTVRINAFRQMNKWLKISNKASYIFTNSDRVRRGASSGGVMLGLLRTPADFDNGDYTGNYYASPTSAVVPDKQRSYRNYIGAANTPGFNNPLWAIYKQENNSKLHRFINSAEISIVPASWFDVLVRAGLDHYNETELNYLPLYSVNAQTGSYSRDEYSITQLNLDVIAKAQKTFSPNFSGNVLIGFNYNNKAEGLLSGTGTNFIIPNGPHDLNNSPVANITNTDNFEKTRTNAAYATIGAGLYDQLFLNATGRTEAASTFGELSNNRFFYPSADVAWQFTKLKSISSFKALSFGKLRGSYGIVGIQPDAYRTATNFFVPNWAEILDPNLDGTLFGGTYVQSGAKGNPYLRPEKKRELEVGADLRFFQNKLSLSGTYYFNKTKDALLDIPQAASTGYTSLYANAGAIENRGVELDFSYNVLKTKKFSFTVDANFSKNKNEVTDLYGATSIDLGGLNGVSSRAVVGQPLGVLWGIGFQRDAKNNYLLDANGFPVPDVVQHVLGNPNPDWRGGIGFTFEYKHFKLYGLFEHSQGGQLVDGTEAVLLDYGTSIATANESVSTTPLKAYNGTVIPAGTRFRGNIQNFGAGNVALEESWYTGAGGYFGNVMEQFIHDATWTRLREVTLSYRLTQKNLPKFSGLTAVDFEVSGRNLWIISKFKNIDPDSNLEGSGTSRGIMYFNNPGTSSVLFSIKLNF
jgi:TonB-linked SusC/RagA family outer membrane protein